MADEQPTVIDPADYGPDAFLVIEGPATLGPGAAADMAQKWRDATGMRCVILHGGLRLARDAADLVRQPEPHPQHERPAVRKPVEEFQVKVWKARVGRRWAVLHFIDGRTLGPSWEGWAPTEASARRRAAREIRRSEEADTFQRWLRTPN